MKNKARTPKMEPAQTTKSSGIWQLAKVRHDTTMSNAVMDTHSMIFVTIGNLVSPPSFPFARQVKGRTGPPVAERKICPVSAAQAGPSSRGVCCLARATCEIRCLLTRGASIRRITNGLTGPRFRWSRDRFVAQLFFGSNPVLDIFSVFAAALKIQLMSPASDLFSRWFSASNHGKTSLVVL